MIFISLCILMLTYNIQKTPQYKLSKQYTYPINFKYKSKVNFIIYSSLFRRFNLNLFEYIVKNTIIENTQR